jgi:hypothetical protein
MSALKELVVILDRHKSEQLKIWIANNKTTNQGLLYKYFLMQGNDDDKKACEYVYGKNVDGSKYRKLKSDLRNSLEDLALFMTIKAKMDRDAMHEMSLLNKEYAIFNNLMLSGANLSLIDKGERLFTRAVNVGSLLIAKTTAKNLVNNGLIKQNKEKYLFYSSQIDRLSKILNLEEKGAIYYGTIQRLTLNTKASLKHKVEEIEKILNEFRGELGDLTSPSLDFFNIILELCMYSAANNSKKVFELAKKGIEHCNNLPFFYKTFAKSFNFYLIVEYGYRKEYEKAIKLGNENLEWLEGGNPNWFKTLELMTYAALRSGNYDDTVAFWQQATQHELYEQNSSPMMRDIFKVYFAQLRLMAEGGRYVPSKEYAPMFKDKLRLGYFKNDLEVTEKDKSGINITVIFIDIVFQIIRGQYDDILDHFEAVQKYLNRYAEEEGEGRVYSYAKLIEGGIRYDWNLKKLQTDEFEPALSHLKNTMVDILNMRFEVEVMPYEELWEFILEKIALRKTK